jgi:hypothetical protein
MARHRSLQAALIIPVLVPFALLAGCGESTESSPAPPPVSLPVASKPDTRTKAEMQKGSSNEALDSTINKSLQNPK